MYINTKYSILSSIFNVYFIGINVEFLLNKNIQFYVTRDLLGIGSCVIRFDEIARLKILDDKLLIFLQNNEVQEIGLENKKKAVMLKELFHEIIKLKEGQNEN